MRSVVTWEVLAGWVFHSMHASELSELAVNLLACGWGGWIGSPQRLLHSYAGGLKGNVFDPPSLPPSCHCSQATSTPTSGTATQTF